MWSHEARRVLAALTHRRPSAPLGIEAAFRIAELVGVDAIADLKSACSRSLGNDNSSAVGAEHEGKRRPTGAAPRAVAHRRVPRPDAGRLDADQDLVGARLRYRQLVDFDDRRWAEAINGGALHQLRQIHSTPRLGTGLTSRGKQDSPPRREGRV